MSENSQRLLSDAYEDSLVEYINDLKEYISGESAHTIGSVGFTVPRFGLLGMKMRRTPVFVYDHPAITAISKTAFTDGVHIFLHAGFVEKLLKEEELSKGMEQGPLPLLLHELFHMTLNHSRRLRQFPHKIANIAEDLFINTKLQLGFPTITWVPTLRENAFGFHPGDIDLYPKLAEETIARELLKNPKFDKYWDENETHTIPLEDLIKIFKNAGLGHILDILEMPADGNLKDIGEIEKKTSLGDISDLQKAEELQRLSGGRMAGGHIIDTVKDYIKTLTEAKLTWELGIREFVLGGGMKFKMSDDEPDDLYYVAPDTIYTDSGDATSLYLESELPHKSDDVVICLIDTSQSVDKEVLSAFLSEMVALKQGNNGDSVGEVVLLWADDDVRGDPIEISTEQDIDKIVQEGIDIYGRGGTDIETSLKKAFELPIVQGKKIKSVVYFSDLEAPIPKKDCVPSNVPVCFVAPKATIDTDKFEKGVKDWATVYIIKEGVEVDFNNSGKPPKM